MGERSLKRVDGYAPIQDYAAIGDGRTLALVARDGSIDWLPLPRFDGETVFARLLDAERGGSFELAPEAEYEADRCYVEGTNVLQTTFTAADGSVRVTDSVTLDHGAVLPWFELARRIEGLSGSVPMRWSLTPRFGAGEEDEEAAIRRVGDELVVAGERRLLSFHCFDAGVPSHTDGEIRGAFTTGPGSDALLVLRSTHEEPIPFARRDWVERRIETTAEDWRRWLAGATVEGEWEDAARRSALALRMLTFARTGGIVAAPTTSLPERIGGDRNYDYRYAWVRDTAFTLDALINLGLLVQVHASFAWLLDAIAATDPEVRVLYDLDGSEIPGEDELELAGYRGSSPVRRGNRAAKQVQLGCYGDVLETAELYVGDGNALDEATGQRLADAVDHLMRIWDTKDSGIWELPELEHYTTSKLTAWSAFDRAARLARDGHMPDDHAEQWRAMADEVRSFVEHECWSDEKRCYVMYPGTDKLDASVLRLPRTDYLDPRSARFSSIIYAVRDDLGAGGALLYRYSGQADVEGAFVACSFWLVEALARAGRADEARTAMRDIVGRGNDVGLFAEEIDPRTGDFLGNFPQGLSHLALVNAAAAIAEETR